MGYFLLDKIKISGIATAIPERTVDREEYVEIFGEKEVKDAEKETVLANRKSNELQTASDLGYVAAKKILTAKQIDSEQVGLIIFASITPDYRSPVTAAVLHYRLGLNVDCIAYDMNIGGAGFSYGMQAAGSVLQKTNKKYGLLILGNTISKQLSKTDKLSMLYNDGASAVLLEKGDGFSKISGKTGASGNHFSTVIHPGGGFRLDNYRPEKLNADDSEGRKMNQLIINQPSYNSFIENDFIQFIGSYLEEQKLTINDFDYLSFQHQNNQEILKFSEAFGLRNRKKFISNTCGNYWGNGVTASLTDKFGNSQNKSLHILLADYGEGLSFGIVDLKLNSEDILPTMESDEYFNEGSIDHDF